jgi:hypothetical protein
VKPEVVGRWLSRLWQIALARIENARRSVPTQIMDVYQSQLLADPMAAAQAIDKYSGL